MTFSAPSRRVPVRSIGRSSHPTTVRICVCRRKTGIKSHTFAGFKIPDGGIILGAGSTLSYYEFKQSIDQRLTDEQWQEMLGGQ